MDLKVVLARIITTTGCGPAAAALLTLLASAGQVPAQSSSADRQEPAAQVNEDAVPQADLRRELLARVERDQKARFALIEWMRAQGGGDGQPPTATDPRLAELRRVDADNRKWLKETIDKTGWPLASQVGKEGAHAAWLLVQHADDDPAFQKHCLELMRKAGADEVSPADVAYLTDRVMIKEKGQQVYGTQVKFTQGKAEPLPLSEPDRVDQLRKEVGLPPLAEYLKMVEKMYGEQPSPDAKAKTGQPPQ